MRACGLEKGSESFMNSAVSDFCFSIEYLFNVEFNMPSLFAENMQVDTLNLSLGYPAEEAVGHEDF